jgi:Fur family ferric uptake transcriptional regulator
VPDHRHGKTNPKLSGLTKGAKTVVDALEKIQDLASAQDIYGMLRSEGDKAPGLTTVYRALDVLVAKGYVQAVDLGDGEKRYELVAPGEHHHHLVCESCSQSNHLDQCVVEEIEEAIRTKYGFLIKSHVLEIFGVCKDCLDKKKS